MTKNAYLIYEWLESQCVIHQCSEGDGANIAPKQFLFNKKFGGSGSIRKLLLAMSS